MSFKNPFETTGSTQHCGLELSIDEKIYRASDRLWHEMNKSTPKGVRNKLTPEQFGKFIAMRDELIMEQKVEIAKLKMKINKLEQRLNNEL